MKILFITGLYAPYIGGGAEISNQLLVEGLIEKEIKIKVLTLGTDNFEEEINGVRIERIRINKLTDNYLTRIKRSNNNFMDKLQNKFYQIKTNIFNIKLKKQIKEILDKENGNILHTSGVILFFPAIWWKLAKKKEMKVVHTLRDPGLVYLKGIKSENFCIKIIEWVYKKINILLIKNYVDCVHSPSQYMIDFHIENGFIFKKTMIIPNTIDISINRKKEKKEYDIVYVGVLSPKKGIRTLTNAINQSSELLKSVYIGDGELKEYCLNFGIEVTGWLEKEEVFEKIKKAKILVLPSEWDEAFGRVLIEAIACGTLVIGSDRGAISEVLNYDEKNIFQAGNEKELLKKIKRILSLSEDEYIKELENLQIFIEKYSYENHINKFCKFYETI